jgi:hypothetical protein
MTVLRPWDMIPVLAFAFRFVFKLMSRRTAFIVEALKK